MSAVGDTLASRARISDPKPAFCSCCWQGAQENVRFVDFDSAFEGGQQIEERDGVIVTRITADDLHLCEACVRSAAEVLGVKPELYSKVARELRKAEREREYWKDYAKRIEALVETRPEPANAEARRRRSDG